jgi:hypothetical protein
VRDSLIVIEPQSDQFALFFSFWNRIQVLEKLEQNSGRDYTLFAVVARI